MSAYLRDFDEHNLGDDQAFAVLMERWNTTLYSFAWHYLRDQKLAREAAVRVLVSCHLQRPDVPSIPVWLFSRLAEICKRCAPKARIEEEPDAELRVLVQAIGCLRHDLRVVLIAQQCTPLSFDEIAQLLHASHDETRHLLHRARQTLMAMLQPRVPEKAAVDPVRVSAASASCT